MFKNLALLIVGLVAIGMIWNFLSAPVNKKQTKKIAAYFVVLGAIAYIIQYSIG